MLSSVALVPRFATPYVNRRAERFVPSAYPTTAHDTRVIAAAWLRVIGGDPAFQGDPGLLLEILERMMQLRLSASLFGNAGVMLLVSVASLFVK